MPRRCTFTAHDERVAIDHSNFIYAECGERGGTNDMSGSPERIASDGTSRVGGHMTDEAAP